MGKFRYYELDGSGLHHGRYSVKLKDTEDTNLIDKMNERLNAAEKKLNKQNKSFTFKLLSCPKHPEIIKVRYNAVQMCPICQSLLQGVGNVTFHKKALYFDFTDLRRDYTIPKRIESFLTDFTTLDRKESKGRIHKVFFPKVDVGECTILEVYKFIIIDYEDLRNLTEKIYPHIAIPDNAQIVKQLTDQTEICKAIRNKDSKIKYVAGEISTDLKQFSQLNGARIKFYHPKHKPNPNGILDGLAGIPFNTISQILKEEKLVKVEIKLFKNYLKKFKRKRGTYIGLNSGLYSILDGYMKRLLGEHFNSVNNFVTSIPISFVRGDKYNYTPHTLSPKVETPEEQISSDNRFNSSCSPYVGGGNTLIFHVLPGSNLEKYFIQLLKEHERE